MRMQNSYQTTTPLRLVPSHIVKEIFDSVGKWNALIEAVPTAHTLMCMLMAKEDVMNAINQWPLAVRIVCDYQYEDLVIMMDNDIDKLKKRLKCQ